MSALARRRAPRKPTPEMSWGPGRWARGARVNSIRTAASVLINKLHTHCSAAILREVYFIWDTSMLEYKLAAAFN